MKFVCSAILFDLDGTLVDSSRCVELVWKAWAEPRGEEPERYLRVAPGRKISETLRLLAPHLDIAAETEALDRLDETETRGLTAMPGASALLDSLPAHLWGIVTSGSSGVARTRLTVTGLPVDRVLVTGESVRNGKPDPEGYLAGAAALGVAPSGCLVVEDTPVGIAAAKAAGMMVIAVTTSCSPGELGAADAIVGTVEDLVATIAGNGSGSITLRRRGDPPVQQDQGDRCR